MLYPLSNEELLDLDLVAISARFFADHPSIVTFTTGYFGNIGKDAKIPELKKLFQILGQTYTEEPTETVEANTIAVFTQLAQQARTEFELSLSVMIAHDKKRALEGAEVKSEKD